MNIYEAMFVRNSCRKFRMQALSASQIGHLEKYMSMASALDESIRCRMVIRRQLDERKKPSGMFVVNAPYYLLFYSEKKDGYLENAGYILEQIVLYMTMHGIASCYQGNLKIQSPSLAEKGLQPIMALAFGLPEQKKDPSEIKPHRKKMSEICVIKEEPDENLMNVLRAGRIAPSSLNMQPWKMVVYHDRIHVFVKKSMLPDSVTGRLDIGILLVHLVYAAEEQWMSSEVVRLESIAEKELGSYEYTATISVKPVA